MFFIKCNWIRYIIVHVCGLYVSLNDFNNWTLHSGYFRGLLGKQHTHQTQVYNISK